MVTALRHGTWMDEESFKKTCIKEKHKEGGIDQPFYGTWVANFMPRQDESLRWESILSDTPIAWKRRRRLGMAVEWFTPTSNHLTRIGKMKSAGCRLCRIVREARGEITDVLSAEIHGPVNSAGCGGMATTVMGAHHSGVRSAQSDDSVLPSAGARTCEANHKRIEGTLGIMCTCKEM